VSGGPIATSLRGFGNSIFAEMTEIAVRTGSINLGQGYPDSDGPPSLLRDAALAISTGENQYPPSVGRPELRRAVARHRYRNYRTSYDPDGEVTITTGATEAIAAAVFGLCDPGDEIVVFDPVYDSYPACAAMAGARLRSVPLQLTDRRFVFDPEELRSVVGANTKLLLLNSPHNPTGKVFTIEELDVIAECCREHDVIAVTDEVHEHLVYDGRRHVTLASLPGMGERTLAISSAGKTLGVTGWKIGWACGPRPLVQAVHTAKQFLTFASGSPFQNAVARALDECAEWTDNFRADLQLRRDYLTEGLRKAGLTVYDAEGTYFLQADVRSWGYDDASVFCRELPKRARVVGIPTAAFNIGPARFSSLVRFSFCKQPDVLREAVDRLVGSARL
jgi:N-succinyldiaminopimelate aminotransferase